MEVLNQKGHRIYYEVHGSGSPIVMLNGIMMSTQSWAPFIERLSEKHTIVLLDFLDQGKSERLDNSYTHAVQVDAIHTVVKHLKLDSFSLFGISYGGEVAIQYALEYPEHISKLLLFNTTAWTSPWLKDIGDGWNAASENPEAYYGATIPIIYSPVFYNTHNEWMENRKSALLDVFKNPQFIEGMRRLTNSSIGYDVRDRLNELTMPTLIVGAELDFVTPKHEQEALAAAIENSSFILIPQCGHASMYERPALFTALILGYTEGNGEVYRI